MHVLQVVADLGARDRHEAEARVLELLRDQRAEHALNLVIDPRMPLRLHTRRRLRRRDELVRVGLDDVAFLEVLKLRDLDAALEAFRNLANVVFEAPQRFDLAVEHHGRSRA